MTRDAQQQPKERKKRCVLTAHDVQSIKDLVFVVGRNSESSAQKAIFETLADNMRDGSRPHPAPARSGCDGCRKEIEHLDCPTPGKCDQMKCPLCCEGSDFPTLPEEIKKYEAISRQQERERVLDELDKWFKEHDCWKSEHGNYWTPVPFPASDLMRLVESLRAAKPQEQPR